MAESETSYFVVIPWPVLSDPQLEPNAKLLYGRISSLTRSTGYCYAGNQTLCMLDDKPWLAESSIPRLLKKLEDGGHIVRHLIKDKSGQVTERRIYLKVSAPEELPPSENNTTPSLKQYQGGIKNDKELIEDKLIKKESKKKKAKSEELSLEDMRPLVTEWVTSIAPDSWSHEILDILENKILEFYGDRDKRPRRTALGFKNFGALLLLYSGGNYRVMMEMMCKSIMSGWTGLVDPRPKQVPRPAAPASGEEDIPEL